MEDSSFLKQRLTEASRTKDLARRLSLVLATIAAAVAVLLLIALTDYWFILPMSVRIGGVLIFGLIMGAGAIRFGATLRRPTALKEVALDAEASKPDAGCELSTAAEYLNGTRKPVQEYEAVLASALEAKAANHLKTVQVPYWNRPIPAALFLGACSVAVMLFVLAVSGGFTAFKRAAAPWSNTPYTRVEVRPGDTEIPVGKDLDITSIFSGRLPKAAQFSWQDQGSAKWQFATLTRNEQGEYVYPLKNIRTPVSYRVSGSDAVSPAFKIEPFVPPEVKDWRVDLNLPAYTKRPPFMQNASNISVLRGSTATIQMAPSTKLSKAHLRFEDGSGVDLKPTENGFSTTQLPIAKDAKFTIELADAKGHTATNETPYQITAFPDEPPKVEILEPGQDLRAEATNSVPIKVSVTDDYGLQEIKLVYHKLGGTEQFITAKRDGETNSEFTAEIPLSSLGLEEFELVAYHAEGTDNNALDGPGVGKSDVYFIEITSKEGSTNQSPTQAKSQRVNLLVIEKQIVADTTALRANAAADKFDELAKRQKDAIDFGNIYAKALVAGGAGFALAEMQSAVADMEKAQAALEKQLRTEALPPSESALAHLYQVVKLMPELKDLPIKPEQQQAKTNRPPMLNVVLDAMKKDKKEDPEEKELADALQEAEQLRDDQAGINIGVQSSGSGKGQGESQLVRASNDSKAQGGKGQGKAKKGQARNGKGKSGKGKAAAKSQDGKGQGQGEGQGQGQGQGKQGDPKQSDDKQDQPGEKQDKQDDSEQNPEEPQDAQALAQKENELSKEASALSEKLARLAGNGSRLGHNAGNKMKQASGQMQAAAQALASGSKQTAGTKGAESAASINSAIAAIEHALHNRPERVDVSEEESPKEYETIIAEYLKKLSYEQ
jgi:hypothetical protein